MSSLFVSISVCLVFPNVFTLFQYVFPFVFTNVFSFVFTYVIYVCINVCNYGYIYIRSVCTNVHHVSYVLYRRYGYITDLILRIEYSINVSNIARI